MLHYRVNAAARTMKTSKTMLFAIIMDDIASSYFPLIVKRIEQRLYENGYNVFIMDSDDNSGLEQQKIELMLEKNVDGFIVCPLSADATNYHYILSQEKPLCVIDQYLPDLPCSQIISDNIGATYQATMRLLNAGHRRIGIVTGRADNPTANERLRGYLIAHEVFGLQTMPELIQQNGFEEADGIRSMEQLYTLAQPPTACIACNYQTVQGAIRFAHSRQLRIPEDLTLVGFDHALLPMLSNLPIPMILQNLDQIAAVTVESLLDQIKNGVPHENSVHRIETDCSALEHLPPFRGAARP